MEIVKGDSRRGLCPPVKGELLGRRVSFLTLNSTGYNEGGDILLKKYKLGCY